MLSSQYEGLTRTDALHLKKFEQDQKFGPKTMWNEAEIAAEIVNQAFDPINRDEMNNINWYLVQNRTIFECVQASDERDVRKIYRIVGILVKRAKALGISV